MNTVSIGRPSHPVIFELGTGTERRFVERPSERELQILKLVAEGLVDKEIAQELGISWRTSRGHINNILHKFGVHNRTQAVRVAFEMRLFQCAEPLTAEEALDLAAHYTRLAHELLRQERQAMP